MTSNSFSHPLDGSPPSSRSSKFSEGPFADSAQDAHATASPSSPSTTSRGNPDSILMPPVNPFSPPPSIRSYSPGTPDGSQNQSQVHFPFHDNARNSLISPRTSTEALRPSILSRSRTEMSRPPIRASSAGYLRESFAHPPTRPFAAYSTTSPGSFTNGVGSAKRPMSTMLSESTPISKPWLESRDPFARIAYFLTYAVIFLGFAGSAIRCYFGYVDVPMIKSNLCLVFEDDFDTGGSTEFSSSGKWFQEIELGGFGNGEFEITTSSTNNSFVNDGKLYIVPTLTSDNIGADAIFNGYTYNLTDCTYNDTQNVYPAAVTASSGSSSFNAAAYYQACGAVSNSSTDAVIPPAQSARLSTRNSASIRYGKVEVRAKLPTGDWLWPAIWMLPVNNTYGAWPMSGEIDIMESRGNGISYSKQGSNYVRASLNWGPVTFINAVAKTFGWWTQKRSSYADDFHTYTLEWTEDFLRTYADTRLHGTLSLRFNEPFFDRGDFPAVVQNGTDSIVLENPWVNGTNAAPFDQPFYLILDVAVGGTSGWFPDNADNKPWIDGSLTAMHDFAKNQDTWYSTWPQDPTERGMVVDSVKMWQQC